MSLHIKTGCEVHAESKDTLLFTFCQNGHCCSISGMPGQAKKCHTNEYVGDDLLLRGDCSNFVSGSMQGNVTYPASEFSATDGWRGESVKMSFDNITIACPINGFIDGDGNGGDGPDYPRSQNFDCRVEGPMKCKFPFRHQCYIYFLQTQT